MSVSVVTTGSTKKAELKWTLQNVTSLEWQKKKPGDKVTSPNFHADGDDEVKWYIQLQPNGDTEEYRGWVSAFLHARIQSASRPIVHAKFTFTAVYSKEKKNVWSKTYEGTFGLKEIDGNHGFGWRIVKLDEVLKSNFFSLVCQVEYADPNPTTKISVLPSPSVPMSNEEPISSLSLDLEKLFKNQTGSDVCFIVEGKEIRAHKTILLARNPVFAAMVGSGM